VSRVRGYLQLPVPHRTSQVQPQARVARGHRAQAEADREGLCGQHCGHHGADVQASGPEPHLQ